MEGKKSARDCESSSTTCAIGGTAYTDATRKERDICLRYAVTHIPDRPVSHYPAYTVYLNKSHGNQKSNCAYRYQMFASLHSQECHYALYTRDEKRFRCKNKSNANVHKEDISRLVGASKRTRVEFPCKFATARARVSASGHKSDIPVRRSRDAKFRRNGASSKFLNDELFIRSGTIRRGIKFFDAGRSSPERGKIDSAAAPLALAPSHTGSDVAFVVAEFGFLERRWDGNDVTKGPATDGRRGPMKPKEKTSSAARRQSKRGERRVTTSRRERETQAKRLQSRG